MRSTTPGEENIHKILVTQTNSIYLVFPLCCCLRGPLSDAASFQPPSLFENTADFLSESCPGQLLQSAPEAFGRKTDGWFSKSATEHQD